MRSGAPHHRRPRRRARRRNLPCSHGRTAQQPIADSPATTSMRSAISTASRSRHDHGPTVPVNDLGSSTTVGRSHGHRHHRSARRPARRAGPPRRGAGPGRGQHRGPVRSDQRRRASRGARTRAGLGRCPARARPVRPGRHLRAGSRGRPSQRPARRPRHSHRPTGRGRGEYHLPGPAALHPCRGRYPSFAVVGYHLPVRRLRPSPAADQSARQ